jgi:hypothetical protein
MKKMILENRKKIVFSLFSAIMIFTIVPKTFAADGVGGVFKNVETIDQATHLIQDKKYEEATQLLNTIKDENFFYIKNLHLGDIAFKEGHYDDAITFYNLAQINSKDKVMYEYMGKKIAYVETVKIPQVSQ